MSSQLDLLSEYHSARIVRSVSATVAGLAIFVAGCGPKHPETFPASGKVSYKGATLQSGTVQLVPEGAGNSATGPIQVDGTFKLGTFEKDDGALPGKYKIAVQVFPPEGEGAGLPGQEFGDKEPPIPLKYMDPNTSELTYEIKSGENKIELDLK